IADGAGGTMRRHDYIPPVIAFTPTAYGTWHRCAHRYRLAHLLHLPTSDSTAATEEGILVHRLLEEIHRAGDCHDHETVRSILGPWGLSADSRTHGFIDRHQRRCPSPVAALGHEYAEARFHRHPLPNMIAGARYDAIWIHDGLLDVRDYKTGGAMPYRVADDPRARLQAWILAPIAESLGVQVSIRYEMLAPEIEDDPEPFVPEPDDLDAITHELHEAAQQVAGDTFIAQPDPVTCGYCPYRSICTHSEAPGTPQWPTIESEHEYKSVDA
ncbi:MAG: PD-(D/E)XK nuclease family protein, partial [Acidimicrobiia bacterium]